MTTDPTGAIHPARRTTRLLASALGMLLTLSCLGDQTGPSSVATLEVTPDALDLMVGEAIILDADPLDAGGVRLKRRVVSWASGDPSVATVSSNGTVIAVGVGGTIVYASSEGVSAQVPVSVSAAVGYVDVTVSSVGLASDPDGYRLVVDGAPQASPFGPAESRRITLGAGMHSIAVDDLDAPCQVSGETSRTAVVVARQSLVISFSVVCPLDGRLVVKVRTSGDRVATDPFQVTVGDGEPVPVDPNGEVSADIRPGTYDVWFSTADDHCLASRSRLQARVDEAATSEITFTATCFDVVPTVSGPKLIVGVGGGLMNRIDVMNPDTSGRMILAEAASGALDPVVSFDGRTLAYRRLALDGSYLVVRDLLLGQETVSATPLPIVNLAWAPDGRHLLASLFNVSTGIQSLVVLRLDGTVERDLAIHGKEAIQADWSPDGSTIAFTRGDSALHLVDPDGSHGRTYSLGGRIVGGGVWSRDGSRVLVNTYRPWCYYYDPFNYCYQFQSELLVLNSASGAIISSRSVPDYAESFTWGDTTDEVYFVSNGEVWRTSPAGSPHHLVTTSVEPEFSVLYARLLHASTSYRRGASPKATARGQARTREIQRRGSGGGR